MKHLPYLPSVCLLTLSYNMNAICAILKSLSLIIDCYSTCTSAIICDYLLHVDEGLSDACDSIDLSSCRSKCRTPETHTLAHTLNSTTGGDHFSVLSGADDANMRLERNPLRKPIAHFVMPGDMDYVVDWMFP